MAQVSLCGRLSVRRSADEGCDPGVTPDSHGCGGLLTDSERDTSQATTVDSAAKTMTIRNRAGRNCGDYVRSAQRRGMMPTVTP